MSGEREIVHAIVTDTVKPADSDGMVISLHYSKLKADRALDALFISEIIDLADGCELVDGEDYEYRYGEWFHSNSEQWWWIQLLTVS